jgi:hypothetical protein
MKKRDRYRKPKTSRKLGITTFSLLAFPFMKFFIPKAKDAAAESVYEGIRKFNAEQMGASLSARRIYSVHGKHDGKRFTATVGETFEKTRGAGHNNPLGRRPELLF